MDRHWRPSPEDWKGTEEPTLSPLNTFFEKNEGPMVHRSSHRPVQKMPRMSSRCVWQPRYVMRDLWFSGGLWFCVYGPCMAFMIQHLNRRNQVYQAGRCQISLGDHGFSFLYAHLFFFGVQYPSLKPVQSDRRPVFMLMLL